MTLTLTLTHTHTHRPVRRARQPLLETLPHDRVYRLVSRSVEQHALISDSLFHKEHGWTYHTTRGRKGGRARGTRGGQGGWAGKEGGGGDGERTASRARAHGEGGVGGARESGWIH